jgi:hypothetical protein
MKNLKNIDCYKVKKKVNTFSLQKLINSKFELSKCGRATVENDLKCGKNTKQMNKVD